MLKLYFFRKRITKHYLQLKYYILISVERCPLLDIGLSKTHHYNRLDTGPHRTYSCRSSEYLQNIYIQATKIP